MPQPVEQFRAGSGSVGRAPPKFLGADVWVYQTTVMGDILARRNGGLGAVFGPMAVRGYRVAAESGA